MNIKEYVLEEFDLDEMKQIREHGMVAGFGQLIYYLDTIIFHDKHDEEIWSMLYEDAESMGCTIMELIAKFNGQKNVGDINQFKNLLCWYAVERTVQMILDEQESN